ncbi:MAG: heavy metal-responsive transcriptional regulator [Blastocatellia bacterium]
MFSQKVLDPGIDSGVYNPCVSHGTDSKAYLRSGELAAHAGVSTDTLRHYERKGLILSPRRSVNGYREYPAQTLDRVRLVRCALAVGFTLDELTRILPVRDKGGAPCRQVRALAAEKLETVETQLKQLSELRDGLRGLLRGWDSLLEAAAHGQPVRLLESLPSSVRRTQRRVSPFRQTAFHKKGKNRDE